MLTVGITGGSGFIGWHLRCHLSVFSNFQVILAGRDIFEKPDALNVLAKECDVIIHLAGVNRGPNADLISANVFLADALISACETTRSKPHIIFANSTHIFRGTAYGESKRICGDKFRAWATRNKSIFSNLILPNVFGEHGRPFYNSVISTFCHQLTHGGEPEIKIDAVYNYVHCSDVVRAVVQSIDESTDGDVELKGNSYSVRELLAKLKAIEQCYLGNGTIPKVEDRFDRMLFNTYRSYLYPHHFPVHVLQKSDSRGTLFEAIKANNGGQVFVSTTHPGITRGNHFHFHKIERFFVIKGQAKIRIRRLFSTEIEEFAVSRDAPCYIDIPTLHTHDISNTGTHELITLFWSDEIFDPNNSDTYPEMV
jgi:UDP-2-acetamido-2,6-beta-L-arabino-hexul-4-ose reductase